MLFNETEAQKVPVLLLYFIYAFDAFINSVVLLPYINLGNNLNQVRFEIPTHTIGLVLLIFGASYKE